MFYYLTSFLSRKTSINIYFIINVKIEFHKSTRIYHRLNVVYIVS